MIARHERLLLAAVFVTALAVRVLIGTWASGRGEMEGLAYRYERDAYAIAAGYGMVRPVEGRPPQVELIALADSLAKHGDRITPARVPAMDPAAWRASALHPPGYAYFLSGAYGILGPPVGLWTRAFQAILDALACVALYFLGRRFGSPRVGAIAAIAAALFLPQAYLSTSRIADALMPAFLLAVFALWLHGLDTRRVRWFAASGLVLGIACLFRPDYLLLPSFLLVGSLLTVPWRTAVGGTAILSLIAVAILVPWGLRNQRAFGDFNLATHAGGMALYQGLGQFPNPYGIVFDDDLMQQKVQQAGFEGIDDPRADRWFRARYMEIARRDPGLVLKDSVRRIAIGVLPLYHWGYDNPAWKEHSFYEYARAGLGPGEAILRHPDEILRAYWDRLVFGVIGFGLVVANLALIAFDRRHWRAGVLLAIPYFYLLLSHAPILVGARLLIPAVFGQFIALGMWADRWIDRPRARRVSV